MWHKQGTQSHRLPPVSRPMARGLLWLLCTLLAVLPLPLAAQAPAGRVVVTAVDDSAYPLVRLAVDVFGADGAPVPNLGVGDFSLTEDGRPVAVQAVTPDASPPLALLLALDRSTDAVTWSTLQTSVAGALATLRPNDQVALTAFFDEVQTVQDFTTDKTAVLNALLGLTPGGEFSAVNLAAVDAVGRFGPAQPARRAVLLVADAPDNTSGITTAQAIAQIGAAAVPIYVVGVGERVQNEASFAQLAQATGGQAYAVPSAAQLGPILAELIAELGQGYRVEFTSTLPADGQEHTVTVAAAGLAATGSGLFRATPGEVTVSFGSLSEGQPVAGLVNLTAQVGAPAAVASIEYRVGETLIGTATDPATPVVWDTTQTPPGQVTLRAIAQDAAGNRGEATVTLLVATAAPRLGLVDVVDDAYPALSLYVDAFGGNGLPLAGLSAANFAVQVAGQAANLTVEVDATPPVQMVLALDRNVSTADWVQLRSAANALIDALRPQDRMAIYTFAASVSLLQPATQDASLLRSALATVEPLASNVDAAVAPPRALYQAILDAMNLADSLPAGRRSVVVLTGGGDTQGQIAGSSLVGLLQSDQSVPVHVMSFGVDGNTAANLAGIAQLTGGSGTAAGNAADLRNATQTLARLLQQGYRVDVLALQTADDRPHTLTLTLNAGDVAAMTEAEFLARRGTVNVTIPNLAAGATVAGAVDLTAEAEAPAPIVAVTYRLNGETLAEVADIAARILWNSDTYAPGPYSLEVNVTDAVGNEGRATLSFNVVAPVTLQARLGAANTDGEIVVGDEITIDAMPEAVGTLLIVEFYVDGVQVGSASQAPYRAVFDSSRFAPGTREVRVVARDRDGYEAVATFPLTLAAAGASPAPTETGAFTMPSVSSVTAGLSGVNWGRWLGFGGGILGLLLLIFGFMTLLRKARAAAAAQKLSPMRLGLTNQGNVATAYLLRGDDPAGELLFRFSVNGTPLGLPPVARLARDGNGATVAAGAGNRAGGVSMGLPGAQMASTAASAIPKSMGGVGEKLGEASMVGRIIADILISLAYFLPRGLAQPLRMVAMQIRRGQMMVRRVENVRRQVGRLNRTETGAAMTHAAGEAFDEAGEYVTSPETQMAAAGAGSAVATTAGAAMSGAGRAANKLFDLTASTARQAGGQAAAALGLAPGGAQQWVYLPTLNPGETVTVDVLVGARGNIRGSNHHPFRILTRALGEDDAQPVIEEGSIRVVGAPWWQRSLPQLLLIGAALVALLAIYLAVTLFWL